MQWTGRTIRCPNWSVLFGSYGHIHLENFFTDLPRDAQFICTIHGIISWAHCGRGMEIPLEAMLAAHLISPRNKITEGQYGRLHGAKKRFFKAGDPVYEFVFSGNDRSRLPGVVNHRTGNVMYVFKCDGRIWKRHAIHFRYRYTSRNNQHPDYRELPLDILYIRFSPHNNQKMALKPRMN